MKNKTLSVLSIVALVLVISFTGCAGTDGNQCQQTRRPTEKEFQSERERQEKLGVKFGICTRCGHDIGDGSIPGRCPSCNGNGMAVFPWFSLDYVRCTKNAVKGGSYCRTHVCGVTDCNTETPDGNQFCRRHS
jgi:hypothetical protein